MRETVTNADDQAIALQALTWTLADPVRADRLLALTGLDAAELRGRLGDDALLAAALAFLEANEVELIDCAGAIGVPAPMLVAARARLEA